MSHPKVGAKLSPLEGYVLKRTCEGLELTEIARECGNTYSTCATAAMNMRLKMGARTMAQAAFLHGQGHLPAVDPHTPAYRRLKRATPPQRRRGRGVPGA